jgi:sulfur carrier protein
LKEGEKMKLNGSTVSLPMNQTLYDFLEVQKYDISIIAVELNGEIVPRTSYKNVLLQEEDTLEVVRFVGGG